MAASFYFVIKYVLYFLPDCVGIRLENNAAGNQGIVYQISLQNSLAVPFIKVLGFPDCQPKLFFLLHAKLIIFILYIKIVIIYGAAVNFDAKH